MIGNFQKQFVDTNILVYAHDVTAGKKHIAAKKLLEELWSNQRGCLSTQVIQEFYVTITKKVALPVTPEFAASIIHDLSSWEIHKPDIEDIINAIHIQKHHSISFWDALIVCSAASIHCDVIWSEDLNNGQYYEDIVLLNPLIES